MFSKIITLFIAFNILIEAIPVITKPKTNTKPVSSIISKIVGANEDEFIDKSPIDTEAEDFAFEDSASEEIEDLVENDSIGGFDFPQPTLKPSRDTKKNGMKSGMNNNINIENRISYLKGNQKWKKAYYPNYYDETEPADYDENEYDFDF